MATKKGSSKKGSSKKGAGKGPAKKGAKKPSKKAAALASPSLPPFPINLRCIIACVEQYNRCLQKGVDRATCLKRLGRCVQKCQTGGVFDPGDAGGDE